MTEHIRQIELITRKWLESIVIDLNLCPFAKAEYLKNRVRYSVSASASQELLLQELVVELAILNKQSAIETTLLITPHNLLDFETYNQFLDFTDAVLKQMNLQGVFQIASFHPDYQFANTQQSDVENYTNRSPYPILHILREASLESAIEAHPNTAAIPDNNIQTLRELGLPHMQRLLSNCYVL